MGNSENYKPTFILIALNVGFYIYTSIVGGNFLTTSNNMIYQWGQVNLFVFNGWYWQLFTSMFVHANIVHIAGNMMFPKHGCITRTCWADWRGTCFL